MSRPASLAGRRAMLEARIAALRVVRDLLRHQEQADQRGPFSTTTRARVELAHLGRELFCARSPGQRRHLAILRPSRPAVRLYRHRGAIPSPQAIRRLAHHQRPGQSIARVPAFQAGQLRRGQQ